MYYKEIQYIIYDIYIYIYVCMYYKDYRAGEVDEKIVLGHPGAVVLRGPVPPHPQWRIISPIMTHNFINSSISVGKLIF